MTHCKETAVKMANDLLQIKLGEARFAYEEELEAIAKQYEDLKGELQSEIEKKIILKRKIVDLENIITQQQNMMETTGYYQNMWEDRKKRNIEQDNKIGLLEKKMKPDPKEIHPKVEKMFYEAGLILDSMFNFYSFGIRINEEQSREVMDQTYPKMLQVHIDDIINEKESALMELTSTRKMTKTFRNQEEKSTKIIFELQMKYEMVREEKQNQKDGFDMRLNHLIRQFVKGYNDLGEFFNKYKDFVRNEMDNLIAISEAKDKIIKKYEYEIGEFKLALKIPRQHYRYIENLRFDELMKQRDEIIEKIKKRYGIDPTKATSLLKMPDPSLPPEQQMEMMANVGMNGKTQVEAKSSPLVNTANDAGGMPNLLGSKS